MVERAADGSSSSSSSSSACQGGRVAVVVVLVVVVVVLVVERAAVCMRLAGSEANGLGAQAQQRPGGRHGQEVEGAE